MNRFLCGWNYYKNPINRHLAWFYYHVHSRSSLRFKETKPQLTECGPWKSEDYLENRFSTKDIPPWKLTCHLKRDHFKTKRVFQPSFLSGYVSLQGSFFWGKGILIIQNWALLGHYFNFQYSFTSRVMIWTLNRPATCQHSNISKTHIFRSHFKKKVRHWPSAREKLLHLFPLIKKSTMEKGLWFSQPSELICNAAGSANGPGRGLSGTDLDVEHVERRTAAWRILGCSKLA